MCDCNDGGKDHRHVYCDICGKRIEGLTLENNQSGSFIHTDCKGSD